MSKWLSVFVVIGCLSISCDDSLDLETDPNGLYTPYLTSLRSNEAVTLTWGRPVCAFCGGCPCPRLDPDYFEVLYSDSDLSNLQIHSVVDSEVFEITINELDNGKPYYFGIRAVISGERYTNSETIMVIPNRPEHVDQLFETVDKQAKLGSWSPDQSSVSYVGNFVWNNGNYAVQSVFISSSSGEDASLVEKSSHSPEWSQVGDKIVYHTDNGEVNTSPGYRPSHIAIYDVENGTISRLTTGNSFNYLPTWSPDGEWIAYVSDKAMGNEYNIWKMPSKGGTPSQLTTDFDDLNDLATGGFRSPQTLSWSADGKRIAFARYNVSTPFKLDVYSVSSKGDDLQTIITSPWDDNCPAYSPDGHSIAFISTRTGVSEIWSMDLLTGELRQITGSTGRPVYENAGKIEWSSSGDRILFTSSDNNFLTLYSVDVVQ